MIPDTYRVKEDNMKISFDFDDTLLWKRVVRDPADGEIDDIVPAGVNPHVEPLLHAALDRGDEVHIVTTRHTRWREDTLSQLREWGVLHRLAGVHFTDGDWKAPTISRLGIVVHHDDDQDELDRLPPNCAGVLAPLHPSWGGVR